MKSKNLEESKRNLLRAVILPLMVVMLVLVSGMGATAQSEVVSTIPAWDGTQTVNICEGGTVTVKVTNTERVKLPTAQTDFHQLQTNSGIPGNGGTIII
jgi:hypothetical protein